MKSNAQEKLCTSVFKDGSKAISKDSFTKKWIDLINRLEKNKLIKELR